MGRNSLRGIPLVLEVTEGGCVITTSHKLNPDGYFRKRIVDCKGRGKLKMFHRHVWESTHGIIPDEYEIDHKCKNRACCNIQHLQMLEGSIHAIKSNIERYADRNLKAKEYWLDTSCTGVKLSEIFDVSFSIACRWIRAWKL